MTFSVDQDFWLFQSGPRQDAMARTEAGEGRGKEFASSLFGVSPAEPRSADPASWDINTLTLATLNLPEASLPAAATPAAPGDPSGFIDTGAAPPAIEVNAAVLPGLPAETAVAVPQPDSYQQAASAPPALPLQPGAATAPSAPVTAEAAEAIAADGIETSGEPVAPLAPQGVDIAEPIAAQAKEAVEAEASQTEIEAETDPSPAAETDPRPQDMAATMAQAAPVPAVPAAVSKSQTEAAISGSAAIAAGAKPPAEAPAPAPPSPRAPAAPSARAEADLPTPFAADGASDLAAFTATAESSPSAVGAVSIEADLNGGADTGTSSPTALQVSLLAGAAGSAASPAPASASLVTAQMTPTHAVVTATTTQLPDIVARATSDGQDDRVVVQLDPPELGRISIDFKFDAQGLQHVTITAESPEAMRQLRLMHFELVQALERNGLSGQNMSFQHQNPQQNESWGQQAKLSGARFDSPALANSGLMVAADSAPHRQVASNGRLDIRL